MSIELAELTIAGVVDDVGFEGFARHYAQRLSLTGRYQTLFNGQLHIQICGKRELIEMFETACWLGPRRSNVQAITMTCKQQRCDPFFDFSVEPTLRNHP